MLEQFNMELVHSMSTINSNLTYLVHQALDLVFIQVVAQNFICQQVEILICDVEDVLKHLEARLDLG